MRVLWVYEDPMMPAQEHIIRHLRLHGCRVETVCIPFVTGSEGRWTHMADPNLADRHTNQHDFHVLSTHNGNPNMKTFQRYCRPKIGCFDLEHDLFQHAPERSPQSISLGVFCFTRQHRLFIEQSGYKPLVARWYKLDAPVPPEQDIRSSFPFDDGMGSVYVPGADGLLIGSNLWPWSGVPRSMSSPFHHLFYKPYADIDQTRTGSHRLSNLFADAQGVAFLNRVSRTWLTFESSCYVEALLFGCLPILCNQDYEHVTEVNEVIDFICLLRRTPVLEKQWMYAVTVKDLSRKLSLLRRDPDLLMHTMYLLYNHWFDQDMVDLPTVHDLLLEQMKIAYAKGN